MRVNSNDDVNYKWRAREESNLDLRLRRPTSYPLDHGRIKISNEIDYTTSLNKRQEVVQKIVFV